MLSVNREEVLGLGAVFLCLNEVRAIAERGQPRAENIKACLEGLLGQYADSVETLYGGREVLATGVKELAQHLSQPQAMQLTRYLLGVIQLDRKLQRDPQRFQGMLSGLERSREQARYFGEIDHQSVIFGIADVYAEQVSGLTPRIMVQGHGQHLQDERNAAMIRCLLLSAIRACGLWRMAGGGRFKLVLRRSAIIEAARQYA